MSTAKRKTNISCGSSLIPLTKYKKSLTITSNKQYTNIPCDSPLISLAKHNILCKYQFGFRSKHSNNMALSILIDKIVSAIDKGKFSLVFFRFKESF